MRCCGQATREGLLVQPADGPQSWWRDRIKDLADVAETWPQPGESGRRRRHEAPEIKRRVDEVKHICPRESQWSRK